MKFSSILTQALYVVLPLTVHAAPAKDVDTLAAARNIHKRDCPSIDTIEQWLIDNSSVGDNTVFYTAGATKEQASNFAGTVGGNYWGTAYGEDQWLVWIGECGEGASQDDLFNRMGVALARRATGTAYVLMPSGGAAPRDFWKNYEYPTLNGNGLTITAVNTDDTSDRVGYTAHQNPF